MARIIPLSFHRHRETQILLPWYVTGQLDAAELARVEAHLAGCAECQADLLFERRLGAETPDLPLEADQAWARLRPRLTASDALGSRLRAGLVRSLDRVSTRAGLGWALAVQTALLLAAAVLLLSPVGKPAAYRALGQPPASPAGNVIVIFRPDASERELRRTLLGAEARLVGGPTSADAYVLSVPAGQRGAALARLRAAPDVVMAEPIDAGSAR